jgi:hypothetical protein
MVISRVMVVGVESRVVGSHAGFMLAISNRCCPAELQGQHDQQKHRQVLFHRTELY